LFNLRPEHRRAVVELGMNHPGEIEILARYAQSTIGLVNNAQREHQEFMATVEAVAIENAEVIRNLPAQGVAVFPAQDMYTELWKKLAGARRVLTFGFRQGDVQAHEIAWVNGAWSFQLTTTDAALACRLNIAGRHNILNALAATACALAACCFGLSFEHCGSAQYFECVGSYRLCIGCRYESRRHCERA